MDTAQDHDERELIIDVDRLRFDYDDYAAVHDVCLQVRRGEVFALLGTNGAGKTTTLEIIQGYRKRVSGTVTVLGVDPGEFPAVLRRGTGVMLQEAGFFRDLSVRDTLKLWQSLSSRSDDVDTALDRVGLAHRATSSVQSLSGGERRRLDLAAAIWGNPELVILDEPTTGLDPASRRTLWALIRELRDGGTTVMLTTHHLEEAESLADHVAIMHAGRVAVVGTLDEVLASQPARVTADLDPTAVPAGWPRARHIPNDVTVTSAHVKRPQGDRIELVVESRDHQAAVLWLSLAARDDGVLLERLRANPASLEEVFMNVRREPTILDAAVPDEAADAWRKTERETVSR